MLMQMNGGEYAADTQNAGAVCLLAQIALPCALFAPSSIGQLVVDSTQKYKLEIFSPDKIIYF